MGDTNYATEMRRAESCGLSPDKVYESHAQSASVQTYPTTEFLSMDKYNAAFAIAITKNMRTLATSVRFCCCHLK